MIYTADYPRAIAFYRDRLGLKVVDEYSTVALPGPRPDADGRITRSVLESKRV